MVFTRGGVVLDKRPYEDWRQVQDQFNDYVTSLGPYTLDGLFEYFALDYEPGREPFRRAEVEQFVASDDETLVHREGE